MPPPENPVTVRPLYFLMIEDDEDHAALILHILRQHHPEHTALHLKDGRAAMTYLQELATTPEKQRPDVILLDLNLQDTDGVELLRKLVDRGSKAHVLLTSGVDERVLSAAYELGATAKAGTPGPTGGLRGTRRTCSSSH